MLDALGPLDGVRIWAQEYGVLQSFRSEEWTIPPHPARCRTRRRGEPQHESPDLACTCGYYAAADVYALLEPDRWGFDWRDFLTEFREGRFVMGPVRGWGRSVPHACGWRAQFARPLGFYELTIPPISRDVRFKVIPGPAGTFVWDRRHAGRSPIKSLARRYRVPRLLPPPAVREWVWTSWPTPAAAGGSIAR